MTEHSRRIDLQCPQCGGPVLLEEDDRVLECDYCRVRLILLYPGFPRYYLEPFEPSVIQEEMVYTPYWRIRSMALSGFPLHQEERVVDLTCRAVNFPFLPMDLGLQARAFKLCLLSSQKKGKFLKPQLGLENMGRHLSGEKGCFMGANPEATLFDHGLIAPSISLVYTPVIFKEGRGMDGLGRGLYGRAEEIDPDHFPTEEQDPSWLVKFKPALCPYCGADLQGTKETVVFLCPNCDRLWESEPEGLKRVSFGFVESAVDKSACWIPFWRTKAEIRRSEPGSSKKMERFFWVPGFKIAPTLFLIITRAINHRSPERLPLNENVPQGITYPVTISSKHVHEILQNFGLSLLSPPSSGDRLVPSGEPLLVYLPFRLQGSEWVQENISLGINKNALTFGKAI